MEIKINHNSSIPLHIQVEELLRRLVVEKEYINGKLLPQETLLAQRLGISRNTLRVGIDKLVREGILERKRGVGTKVARQKKRSARLDAWISFTKEREKQGIKVQTFYSHYELVKIPDFVADNFNLPYETVIPQVTRVKGYDDIRVFHSISYFHPRIQLQENEDYSRPLYDILENKYNFVAANSFEKISAIAADDKLAEYLNIEIGFPLLKRERIVTDPGGRYIEYNIHHQRSDKFEYTINIQRD
ncbi:MAG TPA: GntR family transcriptional regulator [Victivallales bacterium]|nr:GntR family transcriptional regulator [Victivallales bacterium]